MHGEQSGDRCDRSERCDGSVCGRIGKFGRSIKEYMDEMSLRRKTNQTMVRRSAQGSLTNDRGHILDS